MTRLPVPHRMAAVSGTGVEAMLPTVEGVACAPDAGGSVVAVPRRVRGADRARGDVQGGVSVAKHGHRSYRQLVATSIPGGLLGWTASHAGADEGPADMAAADDDGDDTQQNVDERGFHPQIGHRKLEREQPEQRRGP